MAVEIVPDHPVLHWQLLVAKSCIVGSRATLVGLALIGCCLVNSTTDRYLFLVQFNRD
jgi:hypothetical protein